MCVAVGNTHVCVKSRDLLVIPQERELSTIKTKPTPPPTNMFFNFSFINISWKIKFKRMLTFAEL